MRELSIVNTLVDSMANGTGQVIRIPKVGVEGVKALAQIRGERVNTTLDGYVALDPAERGVHLSRLASQLSLIGTYQLPDEFGDFLKATVTLTNAHDLFVRVAWEDLFMVAAPVSGSSSYLPLSCTYEGLISASEVQFFQGVVIPYTSSCPCSRDISDMGAHNQRSWAHINLLVKEFVDSHVLLVDVLDLVPSPIYNVLKRPDEKVVTEAAYQNSQFVEDVARNIAQYLVDKQVGLGWRVKVVHEESIHTHNVVAIIRGGRKFVA